MVVHIRAKHDVASSPVAVTHSWIDSRLQLWVLDLVSMMLPTRPDSSGAASATEAPTAKIVKNFIFIVDGGLFSVRAIIVEVDDAVNVTVLGYEYDMMR